MEALKAADAVVGGDTEARPRPGTSHTTADSASPAEGLTPVSRLREFSYFQTAAWVIAQLADGLQHAHNRGILHRDIKPSNILISSEGQPLLLDFNLSQDQESCARQETLGGTIAYMAPSTSVPRFPRRPRRTLIGVRTSIRSGLSWARC